MAITSSNRDIGVRNGIAAGYLIINLGPQISYYVNDLGKR